MLHSSIVNLRPGMVLAENIVNPDRRLVLAAETVLTSTHIAWLKSLGIGAVYIRNPCYVNIQMFPQKALAKTKQAMLALVKSTCSCGCENPAVHSGNLRRMENIADAILRNPVVLLHLTDMYSYDYRTFVHSVNVCLLSVMTGLTMGYTRSNLRELALGSLLHDLGKILIPPGILNKRERLLSDEWKTIQGHVVAGFEILRDHSQYIPLEAALVALRHHENYDGSGYTEGIAGAGIHEYAEITAIADVYDALSTDRSYRPSLSPPEAYQIMIASRGVRLNPNIVDLFLKNIAPPLSSVRMGGSVSLLRG